MDFEEPSHETTSLHEDLRYLRERVDYHKYYLSEVLNNNLAEAFAKVKNDISFVKQLQHFQQEQFDRQFASLHEEMNIQLNTIVTQLETQTALQKKLQASLSTISQTHVHKTEFKELQYQSLVLNKELKALHGHHTQTTEELRQSLGVSLAALAQLNDVTSAPPQTERTVSDDVKRELFNELQLFKEECMRLLNDQHQKVAALKEDLDELESTVIEKTGTKDHQAEKKLFYELNQLKQMFHDFQQTSVTRALLDELREQVDTIQAQLPLKTRSGNNVVNKKEFDKHITLLTEKVTALREEMDSLEREFNIK